MERKDRIFKSFSTALIAIDVYCDDAILGIWRDRPDRARLCRQLNSRRLSRLHRHRS